MKSNLAKVFEDTLNLFKENEKIAVACKNSREHHKAYKAEEEIPCQKERFSEGAEIKVTKCRTFEAAEPYSRQNLKVAVLNFANSYSPGGGVVQGAKAQEECLCRISTLYDSISSEEMQHDFYLPHLEEDNDLATDDLIYTPDVLVFKTDDDNPVLRDESEWFLCDVVTCAAPCLGWDEDEVSDEELMKIHESRARHILDAACLHEADVVVLGAFGCGAFENPPQVVAQAYKNVLAEYSHAFRTIDFAIFCRDYETENFIAFRDCLTGDA